MNFNKYTVLIILDFVQEHLLLDNIPVSFPSFYFYVYCIVTYFGYKVRSICNSPNFSPKLYRVNIIRILRLETFLKNNLLWFIFKRNMFFLEFLIDSDFKLASELDAIIDTRISICYFSVHPTSIL